MIEKNSVAGKKTISLPVIHRNPMSIELSHGVRTAGTKRRKLTLRYIISNIAVELRGRGLVKLRTNPNCDNRVQQAHSSQTGNLSRRDGLLKRCPYKALGSEVVDFVWICCAQCKK